MISSYNEMIFYIKADAIMCGFYDIPWKKRIFHPNTRKKFLRTLRITEWLSNGKWTHKWMWLPYFIYSRRLEKLSYLCGYSIPLNTLGYGTNLAHHGSCVINGANKIGNYCALMNNVCIADAHPEKIGNGIYFATNVVVAKKTDIANGVKLSANTFVNKSINQENSLWGGIPAKFLKETQPWYYEEPWLSRYKKVEKLRIKMNIK